MSFLRLFALCWSHFFNPNAGAKVVVLAVGWLELGRNRLCVHII